jgi:hypothetical protein
MTTKVNDNTARYLRNEIEVLRIQMAGLQSAYDHYLAGRNVERLVINDFATVPAMPGGKAATQSQPAHQQQANRKLTPAARKRIADATKKRWAEYRAEKYGATAGKPAKRPISAATRRNMSHAQKARHAAERAQHATA